MKTEVSIQTRDGLKLAATVFSPESTCPKTLSQSGNANNTRAKAGVIINSATAVKQGYYERFAKYLAAQGYVVLTYDYRGIGASSIKNSRDKRLTMEAWGKMDLSAIIEWIRQDYDHLDWHCIGHSVGGQIIGLADNNTYFKSIYCVSAQSGYWKHWESFNKTRMFAMWHAVIPGLSIAMGKVPGALLGGESLPEGIARQWAYWGRNKHYIVDQGGKPIREGFTRLKCDMKFLLIDDDKDFAPPKAVKALESYYTNANSNIEVINAKKHGKQPIGHFGFFRKQHEASLWSDVVDWMDANTYDLPKDRIFR